MKANAVIHLNFSSEKQLRTVIEALRPETLTSVTSRSKVQMEAEGKSLVLEFMAKDTSALRAALNSYLRLIRLVMDLQKLTKQQ